jgi:Ca-activated chloride channel family protein
MLAGAWASRLIKNFSFSKLIIKSVFITLGLIFICLALLRPQWDKKEESVMQEGRDVFFALDISRSMLATDCVPNRLACAKQRIKEILKQLDAERVGLILFSGSAFVQCPLTADYSAFNLYLDQVDVETISSGSTALDQALNETLRVFKRLPSRKNKLLVLFTDGEDFSSNLHALKRQAKQEDLRIFAIGVGTQEGAPIPLYNQYGTQEGHQKDDNGTVVITRLNDGILRTLTQDVGGMYIPLAHDGTDVSMLVKKVQEFEKEELDEQHISRFEEQYPYFVLVSFICLAIEWLL